MLWLFFLQNELIRNLLSESIDVCQEEGLTNVFILLLIIMKYVVCFLSVIIQQTKLQLKTAFLLRYQLELAFVYGFQELRTVDWDSLFLYVTLGFVTGTLLD